MNYEEKIKEYKKQLNEEKENARWKAAEMKKCGNKLRECARDGEISAFSTALRLFEEIFAASERSGVGENEGVKEVLSCGHCGQKFASKRHAKFHMKHDCC